MMKGRMYTVVFYYTVIILGKVTVYLENLNMHLKMM